MIASWSPSRCRIVGAIDSLTADIDFSAACAVLARDDIMAELLVHRDTTEDGELRGELLARDRWTELLAAGDALATPPVPALRPVAVWVFRTAPGEPPWWDDQRDMLAEQGALIHHEEHLERPALVCIVDVGRAGDLRDQWAQEFRDQALAAVRSADQPHAAATALRLARRAFCLASGPTAQDVAVLAVAHRLVGHHAEADAVLAATLHTEALALADQLQRDHDTARLGAPSLESRQIRERVRGHLFGQNNDRLRYQILGKLGAGGMGVVYDAYDPILDCRVALKQLSAPRDADAAHLVDQLRREARIMARLRGKPHIVTLYDFFADDDNVFVVMEFVDGTNLRAWQAHARPWQDILDAYLQAGRGLRLAHETGLVHRDFKPENVLMDRHGVVKVADFGLAHTLGSPTHGESSKESGGEGTLSGTLYYMAPEQFNDDKIGPAADQYSYCVALYEALFGHHPMLPPETQLAASRKQTVRADHPLVAAILRGQFRPPPRGHQVPRHIVQALRRGLDPKPADRYPSMHELLAELSARPGRRKLLLAVGGLALAVGATAWTVWPDPPTREQHLASAQRSIREALDIADLKRRLGERATTEPLLAALVTAGASWADAAGNQRFDDQEHGLSPESPTRLACLDLARDSLLDLTTALRRADGLDLVGAADLLAALPRPADCRSLPEPYLRCRVEEARQLEQPQAAAIIAEMQAARQSELAGDFPGASAHAALAATAAERQQLPLLQARARHLEGRLHQLSEQPAEALDALRSAHDQVEASACLDLRVDIASRIVKVIAQNPSLPLAEGERWARSEHNLAAQIPRDEWRQAIARSDRGLLAQLRDGDSTLALTELQAAIDLRTKSGDTQPSSEQADTYLNLGNAHMSLGDLERARVAFETALDQRSAALGADHPLLYREYYALAGLELAAGVKEQALAAIDRAEQLAVRGYGRDSSPTATILLKRAEILAYLRRRDEAAATAARAAESASKARMDPLVRAETQAAAGALLADAGDPSRAVEILQALERSVLDARWVTQMYPLIHLNLAQAHALAGDSVETERAASELIAWLETPGLPGDDLIRAQALLLRGKTRLDRASTAPEQLPGALADLERVLAMHAPDPLQPQARLFLGRSLQLRDHPGDHERACALLEQAEAEAPWLPNSRDRHVLQALPALQAGCRAPTKNRPSP
jgi:tetratricopeptide (TPR) repeat protein/predicted Ser/Thr protein kinase